jgi:L-2-hydroxyglutarate oxidase LhgO
MFMPGRTYHISRDEMMVFLKVLEEIMEPYETHCQRYLLLLEKNNERCYSVSTAGILAIMKSVAMFPDLREDCEKTLKGFADLADIQVEILEAAKDINSDIAHIQTSFINLLKTLAESCEKDDACAQAE